MTTTQAEQLRIAGQLPSPKGVALAIMEVCRRDDATLEEVARIVQTDPALSSRLLRKAKATLIKSTDEWPVALKMDETADPCHGSRSRRRI